jgi:hypothetical protein
LVLRSFYSTCSAPFARPLCSSTSLLRPWFCYFLLFLFKYFFTTPMILLFFAPLAWPCCSTLFVSNCYSALPREEGVEELSKYKFFFVGVECGGVVQIQVFRPTLEGENFCVDFVCLWVFLIINVFGGWYCVCFLCRNYLDIVHLIIHIASHLHNCIVYFFNTLHFIFFQLLVNVYVDFHIVGKILFWQKNTYF